MNNFSLQPTTTYYSIAEYICDGSQNEFIIPFPYLHRNNLLFKLGREELDPSIYSVEWLNQSVISINPSPPADTKLSIQRLTDKLESIVDFRDGSILTEEDLNNAVTQLLYIAQEAYDALNGETAFIAKEEALEALYKIQTLHSEIKADFARFRGMHIESFLIDNPNFIDVKYNFDKGIMSFYLPKGAKGDKGDKGLQGEAAPKGDKGDKGEMGDSPWSIAFGHFRLEGHSLMMDFTGTTEANDFSINTTNGNLEVTI